MKRKLKDLGCVVWVVGIIAAAILFGWLIYKTSTALVWMPLCGSIALGIIVGIAVLVILFCSSAVVLTSIKDRKLPNFDEPDDPDDP